MDKIFCFPGVEPNNGANGAFCSPAMRASVRQLVLLTYNPNCLFTNIPDSELFSTSRHNLGIYRGIANSCQYVIAKENLKGVAVQSVVENALARVILRLGGLRVGIVGEDTNRACFVQVPSMNLLDFIQWKTVTTSSPHDEHVLQLLSDRLEQLWPDIAHRPPWKLLVLEVDSADKDVVLLEIVFAVHHAVADGKSTAIFHKQLLRELNGSSGTPTELKQHVLTFSQPPVLTPSQEELIPFKISWSFFLRLIWSELLCPSWLKPTPAFEPWCGKPICLEPHKLCTRLVTINADTVSGLVSACRTHGATLTAILHVLILASLAHHVPADTASTFSCETSISFRPWARLPPGVDLDLDEALADLATSSDKRWTPEVVSGLRSALMEHAGASAEKEEALIWPLAAEWRTGMKAKVASLPNDDSTGLMGYVSDWNRRWLDCIGKARDCTWDFANIGSMSGVTPGCPNGWSIRRTLFTQPAKVAGPALGVGIAGIEGGELTLAFTWQETIIDATIVDGLVKDLDAWFEHFAETGWFGIFEGKE